MANVKIMQSHPALVSSIISFFAAAFLVLLVSLTGNLDSTTSGLAGAISAVATIISCRK